MRWAKPAWYYRPLHEPGSTNPDVEVISQTCAILATHGSLVYALHTRPIINNDTVGIFSASTQQQVPAEYKDNKTYSLKKKQEY